MALCYKDRTFCEAAPRCKNAVGCWRHLDKTEKARADVWAVQMEMLDDGGNPAPVIAWADFSKSCLSFEVKQ